MTPDEFRDMVYPAISARWAFVNWRQPQFAAAAADIGPIEPELAVQVVYLMAREGQRHPPNGGQIYAKAMELIKERQQPKDKAVAVGKPRSPRPVPPEPEPAESGWDSMVAAGKAALKVVDDHARKGIPLDITAYPPRMRLELQAAQIRRHYDAQIAAEQPIGVLPEVPAPAAQAQALLQRAKREGLKAVPKEWVTDIIVRSELQKLIDRNKEVGNGD